MVLLTRHEESIKARLCFIFSINLSKQSFNSILSIFLSNISIQFFQISSSHISFNSWPNYSPQSPNFIFSQSFSFEPIEIPKKTPQMVEPLKKRKGTSSWSQRHSESPRIRYTNLFSSRSIIDPKNKSLTLNPIH